MRVHRQAGQAAVEGIGITVALALVIAATCAWLVHAARPSGGAPDVIAEVTRPLRGPYDARVHVPGLPAVFDLTTGGRARPPIIGRALRAVGRGARTGLTVGLEAREAYLAGIRERLRERVLDVIQHPLGEVGDLPNPDALTPRGIALIGLRRAGELWDYARFLRTLPPHRAILTASRSTGHLVADVGIQMLQRGLRRRVLGGGRRTAPRRPGDERASVGRTP